MATASNWFANRPAPSGGQLRLSSLSFLIPIVTDAVALRYARFEADRLSLPLTASERLA